MNNDRRKAIQEAITAIEKARDILNDATMVVEQAADDEREYYDNMPESLQGGDKGTTADEAATALEDARDELQQIELDDIISKLEEARG